MVVLGSQVTKIGPRKTLCNSLFTFLTEQGKTGKNGTHGNKNPTTYFGNFGSFDKNEVTKICNEPGLRSLKNSFQFLKVNHTYF